MSTCIAPAIKTFSCTCVCMCNAHKKAPRKMTKDRIVISDDQIMKHMINLTLNCTNLATKECSCHQ